MNGDITKLEEIRWKGKVRCPYCNAANTSRMISEQRYHCNTCNTSFSVTVGTVFHRTRLEFSTWFEAINLVLSSEGRISARQLAKQLNVNKDTANQISHKIQVAMHDSHQRRLLLAIIQTDSLNSKED
jgi:transposase-like protein